MTDQIKVLDLSRFGYRGQGISLGDVIKILSEYPADRVIKKGFGEPDSYRGFYECLAFAPANDVTIGSMLAYAYSANGKIFTGYKGGEYKMDLEAPCYIAHYGESDGDKDILTGPLLRLMCEQASAVQNVPDVKASIPSTSSSIKLTDELLAEIEAALWDTFSNPNQVYEAIRSLRDAAQAVWGAASLTDYGNYEVDVVTMRHLAGLLPEVPRG